MGQALYRAHRPTKLAEIVGQEHITTALGHALKKGNISHAYLFTGPRGTGKTSIARILAHEINGLPYEDEASHLDIIEIDAASNRRIDEIRDLRDKVHTAPTSAKYKVYIIDEVHMLTREAFNALLKTLEEPPAHAIFILATTEVHKLPETIISRTQRFAFKPVDLPKVVEHLRTIAKKEKINIADDALELIAAHGEGSFRDSISLLDQMRNRDKKITLVDVQATLGIAPAEVITDLIATLIQHDAVGVATILQQVQTQGYEPARLAKQLGQALRQALLSGEAPLEHATLMRLLAELINVPASPDPRIRLEISLLDAALAGVVQPAPTIVASTPKPAAPAAAKPKPAVAPKTMSEEVQTKTVSVTAEHPSAYKKPTLPAEEDTDTSNTTLSTETLDPQTWKQVLTAIKQTSHTLYSIAHMAKPLFAPGELKLEVSSTFHQKRLSDKKTRQAIADSITQVTGHNMRVVIARGEGQPDMNLPPLPPAEEQVHTVAAAAAPAPEPTPQPTPAAVPQSEAISTISNIFGGAEVLES
jgi:DNA polymerase-3 subunit gamma/tau